MNKYWLVLLVMLGVTACKPKDERYYQTNPLELQKALKACPDKEPEGVSCLQIQVIARRLNALAYQLQINPQAFGGKILALQQTLAKQQEDYKKTGATQELKAEIERNRIELADLLAVVKWLESPES